VESKHYELSDWHRILLGDAPWSFVLEVILRMSIAYVLLMFAMRLMGKRVSAQLSLFELSIVVTLAAAVGVPLQSPDRGMLAPLIILMVVIILQLALARWGIKERRVELATSGHVSALITDGKLDLKGMRECLIPREKIFAVLRGLGIQQLGQVARLYIEASGDFSLVRAAPTRPGLSIIPSVDAELWREAALPGHFSCIRCAHTLPAKRIPDAPCPNCTNRDWTPAACELAE